MIPELIGECETLIASLYLQLKTLSRDAHPTLFANFLELRSKLLVDLKTILVSITVAQEIYQNILQQSNLEPLALLFLVQTHLETLKKDHKKLEKLKRLVRDFDTQCVDDLVESKKLSTEFLNLVARIEIHMVLLELDFIEALRLVLIHLRGAIFFSESELNEAKLLLHTALTDKNYDATMILTNICDAFVGLLHVLGRLIAKCVNKDATVDSYNESIRKVLSIFNTCLIDSG